MRARSQTSMGGKVFMMAAAAIGVVLVSWGCAGPDGDREAGSPLPVAGLPERPLMLAHVAMDTARFLELLEIEDRRAAEDGDAERLVQVGAHRVPGIRRAAVRALGRLERPDVVGELLPYLADPDPVVRSEAANALAQAVRGGGEEVRREGRAALVEALGRESDVAVRGGLARSLGRIPGTSADELEGVETVLAGLVEASGGVGGADRMHAGWTVDLGVARGAFFLYRWAGAAGLEPSGPLLSQLEEMALIFPGVAGADRSSRYGTGAGTNGADVQAKVRRTAAHARITAGAPAPSFLEALLDDPTPGVRRVAVMGLATAPPTGELVAPTTRALEDPDFRVRVEAVRALAGLIREDVVEADAVDARGGCEHLLAATEDPWHHVAMVALDALATSCLEWEQVDEALAERAGELPGSAEGDWHRPTRAFAALAVRAPERAEPLLDAFTTHSNEFVRAHGARAAGRLEASGILLELADDPAPNVRNAAISELVPLTGAEADSVLVAQLSLDDPHLLLTAARLMEGMEGSTSAVDALFGALERLTRMEAATLRDPRVALLQRIGDLAGPAQAGRIEPYLEDPDPVVAAEAGRLLAEWGGGSGAGGSGAATGVPDLPRLPLPTAAELREMEERRVVVELDHGGSFVVRLLPLEAPTNSARFFRMARRGDFEGLTLHRVVPNFVVQGGSPGANEYAGHGEYTRDERGLVGHWRGTLGVSTRGRDTGDGQIFVNLVDNLRLDHDYTVFGVVEEGMEAVDRVQEGTRIMATRVE